MVKVSENVSKLISSVSGYSNGLKTMGTRALGKSREKKKRIHK